MRTHTFVSTPGSRHARPATQLRPFAEPPDPIAEFDSPARVSILLSVHAHTHIGTSVQAHVYIHLCVCVCVCVFVCVCVCVCVQRERSHQTISLTDVIS